MSSSKGVFDDDCSGVYSDDYSTMGGMMKGMGMGDTGGDMGRMKGMMRRPRRSPSCFCEPIPLEKHQELGSCGMMGRTGGSSRGNRQLTFSDNSDDGWSSKGPQPDCSDDYNGRDLRSPLDFLLRCYGDCEYRVLESSDDFSGKGHAVSKRRKRVRRELTMMNSGKRADHSVDDYSGDSSDDAYSDDYAGKGHMMKDRRAMMGMSGKPGMMGHSDNSSDEPSDDYVPKEGCFCRTVCPAPPASGSLSSKNRSMDGMGNRRLAGESERALMAGSKEGKGGHSDDSSDDSSDDYSDGSYDNCFTICEGVPDVSACQFDFVLVPPGEKCYVAYTFTRPDGFLCDCECCLDGSPFGGVTSMSGGMMGGKGGRPGIMSDKGGHGPDSSCACNCHLPSCPSGAMMGRPHSF
jgi:hypothetical protein